MIFKKSRSKSKFSSKFLFIFLFCLHFKSTVDMSTLTGLAIKKCKQKFALKFAIFSSQNCWTAERKILRKNEKILGLQNQSWVLKILNFLKYSILTLKSSKIKRRNPQRFVSQIKKFLEFSLKLDFKSEIGTRWKSR